MKIIRWPLWAQLLALACTGAAAAPDQPNARRNNATSVQVLVAFYSVSGNTEQMAAAVKEGVERVPGGIAKLKKVEDVTQEDLQMSDAIVLGCPTHYGNMPGKMKTTIDAWASQMKVDLTDKVGGAFSTGGGQVGGKEWVVMSLLIFLLQNRMVVAGPLYQDASGIWGEFGAAAMTGPLDPGVSQAEVDSARRLGDRITQLAIKMKAPHQP